MRCKHSIAIAIAAAGITGRIGYRHMGINKNSNDLDLDLDLAGPDMGLLMHLRASDIGCDGRNK